MFNTKINGVLLNRVLLQGEGGAGKTTLCAKIALDWIQGNFEQFELVLVIPLRTAKDQTVGQIVRTYLSDSNTVNFKELDAYIVSNPGKVLLLLDAFDEMNANLSDLYYIIEILLTERLKTCTVLVTTRPWKAELIRRIPDLRKEYAFIFVEGFDKSDISTYITKYLPKGRRLG